MKQQKLFLMRTGALWMIAALSLAMSCDDEKPNRIFPLTITVNQPGFGEVLSLSQNIHCTEQCTVDVNEGTTLTLTAVAQGGFSFAGWTGGGCEGTSDCQIKMNDALTVTANFVPNDLPVSIAFTGNGGGTITSSPMGLYCNSNDVCQYDFNYWQEVMLEAHPDIYSVFGGWQGEQCSGTGECVLTMDDAKNVTANFYRRQITLSVQKTGTGNGLVVSMPIGIDCGMSCSTIFEAGTQITLIPQVDQGSTFVEWQGACSGNGNCTIIPTEDVSVLAVFSN